MRKITRNVAVLAFALFGAFSANAQKQPLNATGKTIIGQEPTFQLTEANKTGIALTGSARCLTEENEQLLQAKYPNRTTRQEFESMLAPIVAKIKADRLAGKAPQVVYNIPVVVHVIHDGKAINTTAGVKTENISDTQALSQIQVMNNDYRRLAGSPGGANTTGAAVDVEINFCIAQTDPTGNLTTGVVRHNITPYHNTQTVAVTDDWESFADVNQAKAATIWDPTQYLNMWTFKFGGNKLNPGVGDPTPAGMTGLLGFAQFPDFNFPAGGNAGAGGAANTDGVTAGYDVFGTITADDGSFIMNGTYNLGRTMTHEVGHWFGLLHIWGDTSACSNDDHCADTPDATTAHYTCDTNLDTCNADGLGNDMVQNYMDYTNDACMDTFTQNQKDRVQAVMAAAPRRASLNASTKCNAPTPYISFENATQTINEATSCTYTDVTIALRIGKAPSAAAAVTVTGAGTATNGVDYEIIGNPVTFPTGSAADKSVTLRIYNDGFVEGNETLTLGLTVNANGGDAVVTPAVDKENAITITDDDAVPNALTTTSVFTYLDGTAGWGIFNVDGGTTWQSYTGGLDVLNVIQPRFFGSKADTADATTNDYLISPEFTIPAGITSLSLEHALISVNSSQNYELWFATDTSTVANIQNGIILSSGAATAYAAANTTLEVINLTAFINGLQGQTGSFVLRHTGAASGANDDGYLFWDTITLSAQTATAVQTAVNANQDKPLASSGTIYTSDATSGNVMADITNNNNVDYGCVSVKVSRASGTAQQYQVAGAANFVTDKTFTITPTTVQAAGDATVKFYFTETEIAAWETATGNNRSTLAIIKDNGTTQIISPVIIGAFGTEVTLQGIFATGIKGTYYFGKPSALGVADNDFALFNVYPNPSNGNVNITLSSNEDVQVSLFDIRGRKVYANQFNNNSATFSKAINFKSVAAGVYMLTIESGAKKATKKLVIQ